MQLSVMCVCVCLCVGFCFNNDLELITNLPFSITELGFIPEPLLNLNITVVYGNVELLAVNVNKFILYNCTKTKHHNILIV